MSFNSKLDIWNLALGNLGVLVEVANVNEDSAEARACRRFYDVMIAELQRDFCWPFLTKLAALQLVSQNPTTEWQYAYQYPNDCADARRIPSGIRNDNRQSRVPYKIYNSATGKLIYCDIPSASLEYTLKIESVARFDPDFVIAAGYRLSAYIAASVTGGDPFKLGDTCMRFFRGAYQKARANAANEQQDEDEPQGELERSRI